MRILYVSQYFPPEMGAPAARVHELARYWVREGHEVNVLTGFPNHPTGVLVPEYHRKFRRLTCCERIDGINVIRTWLWPLPNRRAHERILNYSSFWLSSSLRGMFMQRPEVVIASSPQLLVGLAGWWLARAHRAPFVFEVRDLWPESLSAVGASGDESRLYRILAAIARFLYRKADRIVVVTPAFKEHLIHHWGVPRDKISIVENGVDTELFTPDGTDGIRRDLQLDGKFVVSYIGTLGMAHGLSTVIETASDLSNTHPEIAFLLVGAGAEKEQLMTAVQERRLKNLYFLDQQPRETIPALLRGSDACLVLLKKAAIFETVIPTKMLECMACARPIILGVNGQARQLMEAAGAGIWIEPENAQALTKAILELSSEPELRRTLGERGRRAILKRLSRDKTAADYLGILRMQVASNPDCELVAGASQS